MNKLTDRLTLGILTGTSLALPFQFLNDFLNRRGITDINYGFSGAKIFLSGKKTTTSLAKLVSTAVNMVTSSLTTTAIVYTLSLTGKDKALLKGAGIGALSWLGIAGVASNRGLKLRSRKPTTPLLNLGEHLLYGALSAYVITKLGDDRLFPGENDQKQRRKIAAQKVSPDDAHLYFPMTRPKTRKTVRL